jgi:hypothetical protein
MRGAREGKTLAFFMEEREGGLLGTDWLLIFQPTFIFHTSLEASSSFFYL